LEPIVSYFQRHRSISALRAEYDGTADRSPAPSSPCSAAAPGAGEPVLTHGQRIALLIMRRSDWSKAVLAKVKEAGLLVVTGNDFRSLVPLGLATPKGHSYHVPTPSGRWRADRIAEEIARDIGIHVISYNYGGYGRAAFWHCTCGARSYHSRHAGDFVKAIGRGGRLHLEHVGAAPKRDVA
jgi:hypothetical protein